MEKLPTLLLIAWLLPLASFTVICIGYSIPQLFGTRVRYSTQHYAGYIAVGAIVTSCVLSMYSMFGVWLPNHPLPGPTHHVEDQPDAVTKAAPKAQIRYDVLQAENFASAESEESNGPPKHFVNDDWYSLGVFGNLKITIGYYIDLLTVTMFCMVTLIASCIHIYALGYMHDELHDYVDHEVKLSGGEHLHRRGRFHRFFQYFSLFSFSMLGICIAGNLAMVFVFWELVGICSYFLIGFYIERKSASTAANKAFIVNRVGDFGMLIGLMALWSTVGTFSFGDVTDRDGKTQPGIFSQLHEQQNGYRLAPTKGMAAFEARQQSANNSSQAGGTATGYWMLFIAGVGIFCGCVGKSAQFPLHVWLPDAMEGPTPVSALVHSATMVAAGVYLVGRCYPIFCPEALLLIAVIGCITLFLAATIAITAVDIKRVLAYSTVSQLGYMMLAIGLGGWVAGLMHLITHAFFKSLLLMCSGSVIHAVHTNDMRRMGGLLRKMPVTAITMLVGCLAIAGVGVPFVIGLSGYYSKDAILEQGFLFARDNGTAFANFFFVIAAGGAAITSFYMFRGWCMSFVGKPRDQH